MCPLPAFSLKGQSMIDVSVVIVSYNTRELLANCIGSLPEAFAASDNEQSLVEYEVIVVDNASTDGSSEMIDHQFPRATLIANEANLGFAAATNQGIRVSQGKNILLLNPDTLPQPHSLSRLSNYLNIKPGVGAVGAKLLNSDGSFQHGAFKFPNLWMSFLDFFPVNHRFTNSSLNGRYALSSYSKPFEIDHPLGACLMAKREVLDEVGELDEHFFMYCEEIDWCIRIKKAGWKIYCVPEATVVHYGGQSTRQSKGPMFVELHKSRFALFKKHYSPFFQLGVRLITKLGLKRERVRMSQRLAKGQVSEAEYFESLDAYTKIEELMKGP